MLLVLAAAIAVVAAFAVGYWLGRRGRIETPSAVAVAADAPDTSAAPAAPSIDASARDAELVQLREFAADRRRQFSELGDARAETARYRQLVVDLENNAPSLLFGPGAPDDLKLIVGVGPILERMLHQLGVTTFRQIAHWSERDIDEFDAKLPEFPGRIRRDTWVTQARELHQSKYGEALPARGS